MLCKKIKNQSEADLQKQIVQRNELSPLQFPTYGMQGEFR